VPAVRQKLHLSSCPNFRSRLCSSGSDMEFLKDLALKIRRGQRGRVEAGRIPGGGSYGYRIIRQLLPDGSTGEREIDPTQATIVQRIFKEHADGIAPRQIAARLNREAVPSPRGSSLVAPSRPIALLEDLDPLPKIIFDDAPKFRDFLRHPLALGIRTSDAASTIKRQSAATDRNSKQRALPWANPLLSSTICERP
jgi:hypothetical protein